MPKTTGVRAELLDGEGKFVRAQEKPGAFFYTSHNGVPAVGIIHSCPCGCGVLSGIYLKPHAGITSPMWSITGPRDAPTLSPSVGIHPWLPNDMNPRAAEKEADGYHWHGYLRNGVWESC